MPAGDQITADGQLEWRGIVLGTGTPYRMTKLEGWLDLAEVRGQDPDRPGRHGAFQGSLLAGKRTITLTYLIKGVPLEQFGSVITTLRNITAPAEQPVEEPLVVRLDGQAWLVNARCIRRTINVERYYAVGHTTGAVQWQATDPRVYSQAEQRAVTGLPAPPVDGLRFPLRFPLSFGSGRSGGRLIAVNDGGAASWPVWEITGPVTGPVITNRDTGQRLAFDPAFTVAAEQLLRIDTDARTVMLNDVNYSARLFTRQWFPIPPLSSVRVDFSAAAYHPTATLTGRWRHAII
jgi:hypothetical protein